jgi:site-specific recombinase XerD
MGHRFVETTQNYALANDKQVQADFYKACERLEGWTLLLESSPMYDAEMAQNPDQEAEQETVPIEVLIPARISGLPAELAHQLEAYRQLQLNRWRAERVRANSILFFSKHGILWKFFCSICGVRSASQLQLEHVLQFVQARLENGRSARTVNGSLSSLHSFLSYLKEDGVAIHPSLDHIQRLKEAERLPRSIPSEQVQRLKAEVDRNVQKADSSQEHYDALLLRAIFYLLWQGGLRSGEVELLRFPDFYISKANLAKRLFVRDGKWRKGRVVYLTEVALHAFQEYLAVRGTKKAGDFVFVRNGMPLKKNFLGQRLKRLGRHVGVKVSCHRLRHTFATQLLNVGCKVTSIQKLLGHTNLNTTMTYARALDQTVMEDYFQAVTIMETQPEGAWYGLNAATIAR